MPRNGIFAKQMARKLKTEELGQVGGGILMSHTMRPGSCSAGGGVDWIETGMDLEL
jgi:hypothetical protein